jgi:hypothetical protein
MNYDDSNHPDMEARYRETASDATREREAEEWIEGLISDASTEE